MHISRRVRQSILGAAGALLLAPAGAHAAIKAPACDSACLQGVMNQYLDGMLAHDPSRAPFAPNARFTENAMELKLPDGLWRTAGKLGEFRIWVADPEKSEVGLLTTGEENGGSLQLGVRLHVENGKITKAETIVYRHSPKKENGGLEALPPNLRTPRPQFTQVIPPANRKTREQLIEINNAYWEGIEQNDGKVLPPFADDCHRYEGGRATTNRPTPPGELPGGANVSCKEAFGLGYYREVKRIRDRRFLAVDTVHGLVYQSVVMEHDTSPRSYKLNDGRTRTLEETAPWAWLVHVVIQVDKDGNISQIEGLPLAAQYGVDPGWRDGEKRATSVQDGPRPW